MKSIFKSLSFVVYFFVSQLAATIGLVFWKINADQDWFESVSDCLMNGTGMFSAEYFSLVSEILFPALVIADLLIIVPMIGVSVRRGIHLFHRISIRGALSLTVLAGALNMLVSYVVDSLPESSMTAGYNELTSVLTNGGFGIVLLTSGILAPIVEELIFRFGFIYLNRGRDLKLMIFISSLAFGIAHMNPVQSTYAFLLGLVLGYVYVKSDFNLLSSIIMHITINSTSVIYEYAGWTLRGVLLGVGLMCMWIVGYQLIKRELKEKYYGYEVNSK